MQEFPSDNAPMNGRCVPDAGWKKRKARLRLRSIADLDGRTQAAQFAKETRDAIIEDRGGADSLGQMDRSLIEHWATGDAILRDAGIRWLKGEGVAITEWENLDKAQAFFKSK